MTLVAEFSGLPWHGNADTGFNSSMWSTLKRSGESPFGVLPILDIDGIRIGQTTAIVNYIAKKACMDGSAPREFAMSQMLLALSEEIYAGMQKYVATKYVPQETKGGYQVYHQFVSIDLARHISKLEAFLGGASHVPCAIRGCWTPGSSPTSGELALFGMLYQMYILEEAIFDSTPKMKAWFMSLKSNPKTQKVLDGKSSMGKLGQYFVRPIKGAEEKALAISLGFWVLTTTAMIKGWLH